MTDQSDTIRLGVLGKRFGLDGGFRCRLDFPNRPEIETPCKAKVGYSLSFAKEIELSKVEEGRAGEIVCYFTRFEDRSRGEELLEMALFLNRELVTYGSPMDNPELLGYEVFDQSGECRGKIVGMIVTAAHPVWRVEKGEREWMVPAIDEFVVAIDRKQMRTTVLAIPGLFDDDAEEVRPDDAAD